MENVHVAIFGHSYVRDLSNLNRFLVSTGSGVDFRLHYFHHPGATFETFLKQPRRFDSLVDCNPRIVICLLGGNDIRTNVDLKIVYEHAKEFYKLLKSKLPKSLIVASQVEDRYLKSENRFGTPPEALFHKLANHLSRAIKNITHKDKLLMIRGRALLSNKRFFVTENVHLNQLGLNKLFDLIVSFLIDIGVPYIKE